MLLLASCGEVCTDEFVTGDFVTRQGFEVDPHGHPTSPEEVGRTIDLVGAMLTELRPATFPAEAITRLHENGDFVVTVVKEPFDCSSGRCLGVYNYDRIRYVYAPCIGDTALAHELIHLYGWLVAQDSDHDHEDPGLFAAAGGAESIEARAANQLQAAFCGCEVPE